MKKIIIVYHAYIASDNYMDVITDQFRKILTSRLFTECDKMLIGAIEMPGHKPQGGISWINTFWSFPSSKEGKELHKKVEIIVHKENKELTDTLKWIRDYSKNNPGDYICFVHPKGITHNDIPTNDWRKYMDYFIIERWGDCVKKLNEGYDTCGVMWNSDTVYGFYPHFSGCMFWANTDYINTLDHSYLDAPWRYGGEFWIGSNRSANVYEFHNSRMNDKGRFAISASHYSLPYPRERYENT